MKTTFAEVGWWHLSVRNPLTREASNKVADIDVICCGDTFRDASFGECLAGLSVFFLFNLQVQRLISFLSQVTDPFPH